MGKTSIMVELRPVASSAAWNRLWNHLLEDKKTALTQKESVSDSLPAELTDSERTVRPGAGVARD